MSRIAAGTTAKFQIIEESYPLNASFRTDWQNLYLKQSILSPFSRLEWIETGILVYAENQQIFPLRFVDPQGKTRAMAIFRMEVMRDSRLRSVWPVRTLRTVDFNSQRIIPILAETKEDRELALCTLLHSRKIRFDRLDLYKVDGGYSCLKKILDNPDCKKEGIISKEYDVQPQFMFFEDWESYLAQRTQGHRKKIRRYTRKLQEAYPDYTFTRLRTVEDFKAYGIEVCMEEMTELFGKSWQAGALDQDPLKTLEQYIHFYERIFRTFLPLGMLDYACIHADGKLLAFDMSIWDKGHVFMVFGAYDPDYRERSPGTANLVEIIKSGFELQDCVLEFGGGFLEYKRLWANAEDHSYEISYSGNTLRGFLTQIAWRLK